MPLTHSLRAFVRRWWFALILFFGLVVAALLTTPSSQALVGKQAQLAADYVYYIYLSLVYKT